jgi:succinyl-CoA synthetase beta subunit
MFINRLCKNPIIQRRSLLSTSSTTTVQKRFLNLHEYQSHQLLAQHGVQVPKGKAVTSPEEAYKVAQELIGTEFFVKAQILAGGRGRGTFKNGFQGGVHKANE